MKLLLVICSFLSVPVFTKAQQANSIGILKYTQITALIDTANKTAIPYELQFTRSESVSKSVGLARKLNPTDSIRIWYPPRGIDEKKLFSVYINWVKNRMVSRQQADVETVVVDDTLKPIYWKIHKDVKYFGTIKCQRAEAFVRGRTYEAWFAPEIPVSSGPWKLHGLPGLILEASDLAGHVHFRFERLQLGVTSDQRILPPASFGQKVLNEEQFLTYHKELTDKFHKMVRTQPGWETSKAKVKVYKIEVLPD